MGERDAIRDELLDRMQALDIDLRFPFQELESILGFGSLWIF
jgi:hypothetical protein